MTDRRERGGTDYQPRAADSAACLLIVGGYEEYDTILRRVVSGVRDRVLMSPALGDFIEVRFCDLGPRPRHPGRGTTEVARLVLELTSRPRDVARNFSAVLLFDQSALVVDGLLQACAGDPALLELNARCLGMASWENRPESQGSIQSASDIVVARKGRRSVDEFVFEIYGLAERLLNDFGSGWQPGVRPEAVSRLGSVVEPAARGVIKKATIDEDARLGQSQGERAEDETLRAAKQKAAERQELAAREAAAWEAELAARRAESELRQEAERLAAAKQQIAELEREVADLRRGTDGSADPPAEAAPLPADVTPKALDRGRDHESEGPSVAGSAPDEPPADQGDHQTPGQDGDGPADRPANGWQQRIRGLGEELAVRVRSAPTSGSADVGGGAVLLSECVKRLKAEDSKGAGKCLPALRRYASVDLGPAERTRYRAVTIEVQALSPHLPLGSLAGEFYDVLLKLVYGQEFGYQQYRDLEYCLETAGEGALPPALALVKAIDRTSPTDPLVLALTRYYLSQSQPLRDKRVVRSRPGDTRRLIVALAEAPLAAWNVDVLFAVLARYLSEVPASERKEITRLLRDRSFLATALVRACPDAMQRQVAHLIEVLSWAYPKGIDRHGIETLTSLDPATSALLPAILTIVARPSDRPMAIREFLRNHHARDIDLAQAAELEPVIMRLPAGGGPVAGEVPGRS